MGLWEAFFDKTNAITVQRLIVPWLVALYGLKYAKSIKLDLLKEMVIKLSPKLDFVGFDVKTAAEEFPVGFTEVAKRAKSAAGIMYWYMRRYFSPCESVI